MAGFYVKTAKVLDKILSQKASIKNVILSSSEITDKKRCMALICHTLEYKQAIEEIIKLSDIQKHEKSTSTSLLMLLLHDYFFGDGLKCGGPMKQTILRHKTRLSAELIKLKVKRKAKSNEELKSADVKMHKAHSLLIPRHVRVNTLKITVTEAIRHFQDQGYELTDVFKAGSKKEFAVDKDVPFILVFNQGTDFHTDKLYLDGSIILQEKSSCFPSIALYPPLDSMVIDACAAPGNKTTLLSALMKNTGKIFAFDMDPRRFNTLKRNIVKSGCKSKLFKVLDAESTDIDDLDIEGINGNFMELDPTDKKYEKVEYVLLDPSCSGSGIVSRMDSLVQTAADLEDGKDGKERLAHLASFQESIILHAMKFPNIKKIVYSTCSVHEEENEKVIHAVLSKQTDFEIVETLGFWKRRGLEIEGFDMKKEIAEKVVRCCPEDGTNGFFVSCFMKR